MNSYYRDDCVEIVHGDCRGILPGLPRADLVLTDPPYNIGFGGYSRWDDRMPDEEYIGMLSLLKGMPVAIMHYPEEMMKYVVPALGPPDEVLSWCYNSNLKRGFRLINVYGKTVDFTAEQQPYKNPKDRRILSRIASGSKGARLYDWFNDIQLVKNVSREKTAHPCPLPEKLVMRLLAMLTRPGDLVIDPFAGSGTIPYCAKVMGRRAIGCEVDESYCATAARRCADALVGVTAKGRTCYGCGSPLTGRRSDSRYCSPACRQEAYRGRASRPGDRCHG